VKVVADESVDGPIVARLREDGQGEVIHPSAFILALPALSTEFMADNNNQLGSAAGGPPSSVLGPPPSVLSPQSSALRPQSSVLSLPS